MSTPSIHSTGDALLARLRQLDKKQALTYLKSIDPGDFETLIAALFAERGFAASVTQYASDEGVDVYLRRGNESAVVQCKRYEGSVGQPVVRDLYGTMMHNEADAAYLVTTGTITSQARDWAFGKPIHLIDGYGLTAWIMDTGSSLQPAPARRNWLWPAGIALAIFFGFVVAVAFTRISGRLRPDGVPLPTNPPPTAAVAVATTDGDATDGAAGASGTPTDVTGASETATAEANAETPTPAPPTATPTPCAATVDTQLADLYTRGSLGCATGGSQVIWAAWEPFERGYMLWRSDTDAAYAFYGGDPSTWFQIDVSWDGSTLPDRGAPPPGLQAPKRGFGYAWSVRDDIFQNLGWATDREKGFCALMQPFEDGYLLKSAAVPSCTPDNLYNEATGSGWTPVSLAVHQSGVWSGTALPDSIATADAAAPSVPAADTSRRPTANGLFTASAAGPVVLDGDAGEWPAGWMPIAALVQGSGEYAGANDLSADFQVQWSSAGLYLAVRVHDELYRSGPDGTNMWQGDGLEIHLDRELAADFVSAQADSDDYQLGISFGPDLNEVRVYRWLPYAQEGAFRIDGGVRATAQGYDVEVLIPWYLFDLAGDALSPELAFGFNVSVNDNDGSVPAQQSVISASSARTTFDNPTEWGTLVLAR